MTTIVSPSVTRSTIQQRHGEDPSAEHDKNDDDPDEPLGAWFAHPRAAGYRPEPSADPVCGTFSVRDSSTGS